MGGVVEVKSCENWSSSSVVDGKKSHLECFFSEHAFIEPLIARGGYGRDRATVLHFD
ncbi:MAG: hypothetical protein ACLQVI_11765 [Polyangiaceae bacterium]